MPWEPSTVCSITAQLNRDVAAMCSITLFHLDINISHNVSTFLSCPSWSLASVELIMLFDETGLYSGRIVGCVFFPPPVGPSALDWFSLIFTGQIRFQALPGVLPTGPSLRDVFPMPTFRLYIFSIYELLCTLPPSWI